VWTDTTIKTGLDPLGMQNSSVALYQEMLPGISNVTLRMRYYGLYAWLASRYARDVRDRKLETWKWHVRRAELLYALIAQKRTGEGGVAGTNWAANALREGHDPIDFGAGADPQATAPYLRQEWGAYGAAYYDDTAVPVPSEDSGDDLAAAFGGGRKDICDLFFEVLNRGTVTHDELVSMRPLAPSDISTSDDERARYEDLLFGRMKNVQDGEHARRKTLLLVLHLAQQMGTRPSTNEVRWAFYTAILPNGAGLHLPSAELREQRESWWMYQLDDLSHMCMESLLKYALDVLGEYPAGAHMRDLVEEATARVVAAIPVNATTWSNFAAGVLPVDGWGKSSAAGSEFKRVNRLVNAARPNGCMQGVDALNAIELLIILGKRATENAACMDRYGKDLASGDAGRSVHSELAFIDSLKDRPFSEVVARLIRDRVLNRHLWVAMRKLRYQGDYTFLVEDDDGRIRLREKDGPVMTTPRLDTSLAFLKDIHLLDDKGITTLGLRLIA
jgi:hypothetical protein